MSTFLKTTSEKFPTFDSPRYNEIKQFEPYEFSACVAYEAAIRVPKIQEALSEFSRYYHKWKSLYCKYELQEKATSLHRKLDLILYGFDLEATFFFYEKKFNPDFHQVSKKLITTPIKYQEDLHTGNVLKIKKKPDGGISRKDMTTGEENDWYLLDPAPSFILRIKMQRPVIKNLIRHHFFYSPMNYALDLNELIQQVTITKELHDKEGMISKQAQEKYKTYLDQELKISDKNLKEVIMKLSMYSSRSEEETFLSAGDIVAGGSLPIDQISRKKHDPANVMAQVFFVYDSLIFMERVNAAILKKEKISIEQVRNTYYDDQVEEAIELIRKKYKKMSLTMNQIKNRIDKQLNKHKKTENRGNKKSTDNTKRTTNFVDERWAFAKKLISDEGYKSLI